MGQMSCCNHKRLTMSWFDEFEFLKSQASKLTSPSTHNPSWPLFPTRRPKRCFADEYETLQIRVYEWSGLSHTDQDDPSQIFIKIWLIHCSVLRGAKPPTYPGLLTVDQLSCKSAPRIISIGIHFCRFESTKTLLWTEESKTSWKFESQPRFGGHPKTSSIPANRECTDRYA